MSCFAMHTNESCGTAFCGTT